MGKRPSFDDFAEVTLIRSIEIDGFLMPEGTHGIVMAAYEDGLAYEVEFECPAHMVLTLEEKDLRLHMDASG